MLRKILLVIFIMTIPTIVSAANWSLAIRPGVSEGKTAIGLGVRKDINDYFESNLGKITFAAEGDIDYWANEDAFAFSVSPVLRYTFKTYGFQPYIEGGIALAALTDKEVHRRELGESFLFRDYAGLGLIFGNFSTALNFVHFSNAGLDEQNDGINIYSINLNYHF